MTVQQFLAAVYVNIPRDWRRGQAAFNGLLDVRPDLAEQIRATDLDPFYRDDRLPAFEAWLLEAWGT